MSDEALPILKKDNIELADDGSPLGTLLVDGTVYTPEPRVEGMDLTFKPLAEVQREELQDLTGEDGADEDLITIYEGYSDPALRKQALELYVRDGLTALEVSKVLKVPEKTVEMWAYNGKWNRLAGRSVAIRAQEEARGLANLRMKVRRAIIESQLEGSKRVRERILQNMDNIPVKSAAEALKAAADVEARALGMSESGSITMDDESSGPGKKDKDMKTPLVLVVNNGSPSGLLPVRKREPAIDAEAR